VVSSVALYICNMITFESLQVESPFLVCGYIFMAYGSSCYMSSGPGEGLSSNKREIPHSTL